MNAYPHLLSPITLGQHTLRNRVIMGSMHTRLEYADRATEREIAFYRERAAGGVALIVTAGCSPNEEGCLEPGSHTLCRPEQVALHRPVTAAVQAEGAKMVLQILHAGRYAKHAEALAPSAIRSPISKFTPREMSADDIERTLADYLRCAQLAAEAGYDGVEIMGSEGYLITQFTALRTNARTDHWGGSLENRCRFALEIVRRIRAALGPGFLLLFRLSALDLVEGGLTGDEIDYLARQLQAAGVDALSTGIGWHEAIVPTISYHVPRAAWGFAVARLKQAVSIPVVASNRINTPEVAESLLATGQADLVALARPLLADAEFVNKAARGEADQITPCIACNQACLDYIFKGQTVCCLVNPRTGRELDFPLTPATTPKKVVVVGAGPAGLSAAITAARRGHQVTLYEAGPDIGGQLNLAKQVPDKGEFHGLLAWFRRQLALLPITLRLGTQATAERLAAEAPDHLILATGIKPRIPDIPGVDHPKVVGYEAILSGRQTAGQRVVILGTGGIAHDVAAYLLEGQHPRNPGAFYSEFGVDTDLTQVGGLTAPQPPKASRQITFFQRSTSRPGAKLGLTTSWVLRNRLANYGVQTVSGCHYTRIDDQGLHYQQDGESKLAPCDTLILCTGQEANATVDWSTESTITPIHPIGGLHAAGERDAMAAIREGFEVGMGI